MSTWKEQIDPDPDATLRAETELRLPRDYLSHESDRIRYADIIAGKYDGRAGRPPASDLDASRHRLPEKLHDAFKRKRHGGNDTPYDPDFDLFDAAADEIERLHAMNAKLLSIIRKAHYACTDSGLSTDIRLYDATAILARTGINR